MTTYSCIIPSGYTLTTEESEKYPVNRRFSSIPFFAAIGLSLSENECCEILGGDDNNNWTTAGIQGTSCSFSSWTVNGYFITVKTIGEAKPFGKYPFVSKQLYSSTNLYLSTKDNLIFIGITVEQTAYQNDAYYGAIIGSRYCFVIGCLFKWGLSDSAWGSAIYVSNQYSGAKNNIIYNNSGLLGTPPQYVLRTGYITSGYMYLYNNTVVGFHNTAGILVYGSRTYCKNNISISNLTDFVNYNTNTAMIGYNYSGDASAPGANSLINQSSDIFVDPENGNFHVVPGAPVIGAGIGPALDSFVFITDIDDDIREGDITDIGADLYVEPPEPVIIGLSGLAEGEAVIYQWLFDCGGLTLTDGQAVTIYEKIFTPAITSFSGIPDNAIQAHQNLIPENKTTISIFAGKDDISRANYINQFATISLAESDGVAKSWVYIVDDLTFCNGVWSFDLVDPLSFVTGQDYPIGELVSSYDESETVTHAGDSKACVPEIFGEPYIPVRTAYMSGQRYYIIGPDDTYTISEGAYPVEWPEEITFSTGFTQTTISGLGVLRLENHDAFYDGQLFDMPLKYSRTDTASLTNPADILSYIIQQFLPVTMLDLSGTWATAKATFETIGIELNIGFYVKSTLGNAICSILRACNATLRRTNKIELVYLDDVVIRNIDSDVMGGFQFNRDYNKQAFDGGYIGYWPTVQGGEPVKIAIPVNGESFTVADSDTIEVPGLTDTVILQKIGIRGIREKLLRNGEIRSNAKFCFDLGTWDKITVIDDPAYNNFNHLYVESVKISQNLIDSEIVFSVFSSDLGDLDTFLPSEFTPTQDDSVYTGPSSNMFLKALYLRSSVEPELPDVENPDGWATEIPGGTDQLYMIQAWFGRDGHFWPGCNWMGVISMEGIQGAQGVQGDTGPGLLYKGQYSAAITYIRTAVQRQVVSDSGVFYAVVQTCQGQPLTDPAYWEAVPGFASIATDIFLAYDATILKTLNIGWTPTEGALTDCCMRSGMSDPDTGDGFYIGRVSGLAVASFKSGSTGLKVDSTGSHYSGTLTIGLGSVGLGNFADALTSELVDDANLGTTSLWSGVTGTGKPYDGADVTQTVINAGLITTGAIADAALNPNLRIDFGSALITVGVSAGLSINGSLNINQGGNFNIAGGGDFILTSDATYASNITFRDGAHGLGDCYFGLGADGQSLILKPENADEKYFGIGTPTYRFNSIGIFSDVFVTNIYGDMMLYCEETLTLNSDDVRIKRNATSLPALSQNQVTISFSETNDSIYIRWRNANGHFYHNMAGTAYTPS